MIHFLVSNLILIFLLRLFINYLYKDVKLGWFDYSVILGIIMVFNSTTIQNDFGYVVQITGLIFVAIGFYNGAFDYD